MSSPTEHPIGINTTIGFRGFNTAPPMPLEYSKLKEILNVIATDPQGYVEFQGESKQGGCVLVLVTVFDKSELLEPLKEYLSLNYVDHIERPADTATDDVALSSMILAIPNEQEVSRGSDYDNISNDMQTYRNVCNMVTESDFADIETRNRGLIYYFDGIVIANGFYREVNDHLDDND